MTRLFFPQRLPLKIMNFGVYLHYPYCRARCAYCDFFAMTSPPLQDVYAQAVAREFLLRESAWKNRVAQSVYVGGGTPSLWAPKSLYVALDALRQRLQMAPNAEWTLEADPGTLDDEAFFSLAESGINRLSIGAQTFDENLLRLLGRQHGPEDIVRCVHSARRANFTNVSLDVIYGLPGQTLAMAEQDVQQALALKPNHLSSYELMVRDTDLPTRLGRDVAQKKITLPDEDTVFEMERLLLDGVRQAGFERYEISNFSQGPDFASRHNKLYWSGGEYLGLGIGAVGFAYEDPTQPWLGGVRWQNHRVPKRYFEALDRGELPEFSREFLDGPTLFRERIQLGLRQTDGLDVAQASRDLGVPNQVCDEIFQRLNPLQAQGLASQSRTRIALTDRGMDLHTEVVLKLLK